MSTMTRPTTSTAYCATATNTLGVLTTSSSASASPGALPEESCQDELETSCLPFFFFGCASVVSDDPLAASATTDQEPGAAAGVAGRLGSTGGGAGSAAAGACFRPPGRRGPSARAASVGPNASSACPRMSGAIQRSSPQCRSERRTVLPAKPQA